MPRIQQHTHKLKRHTYKTTGHSVFFCVLDCGFKVDTGLALGKKTICWRCGKETQLNEYSLRAARPVCPSCVKKKTPKEVVKTTEAVIEQLAEKGVGDLRERLGKMTFAGRADEEI